MGFFEPLGHVDLLRTFLNALFAFNAFVGPALRLDGAVGRLVAKSGDSGLVVDRYLVI